MSNTIAARPLQSDLAMTLLIKLYRNIFKLLSTSDLKQLCLVSRSVRREAEAVLYESCVVPDGMLDIFCRAVVEHPSLCRHVRALSCTTMGHRGATERDHDLALISQGLKSLHNLRDLSIASSFFPLSTWTLSMNDSHVLQNADFKLRRLSCPFIFDDQLHDFLFSQPSIESFIHTWGTDSERNFASKRPLNIRRLSCATQLLQALRLSPAISHLSLDFGHLTALEEQQGALRIRQFSGNLISLCIRRYAHPEEYLSMARIVSSFASYTPNLQFLALYDESIDHSATGNARLHKLVASSFKDLRVFIWAPAFGGMGGITYESSSEAEGSESEHDRFSVDDSDVARIDQKTRAYATSYMHSCPRLEMFSAQRSGMLRIYRRSGEGFDDGRDGVREAHVALGVDQHSWEFFDADDPWGSVRKRSLGQSAMRTTISASVFRTAKIKEYI